jgi:hypothetical protein
MKNDISKLGVNSKELQVKLAKAIQNGAGSK